MNGINNKTGKLLKGHAHLRQSIADILTTPIGTRIKRREYGSRLFELVDAPLNEETVAEIYAATVEALERWEPRLKVLQVKVYDINNGHFTLDLIGEYLPDGKTITLEKVVV